MPFLKKFSNSRGNLLVVLVISTLLFLLVAGVMREAVVHFKSSAQIANRGRGDALNRVSFSILSEKFRINGFNPPVWYPDPYPSASALAAGRLPIIEVIIPAAPGSTASVPTQIPNDDRRLRASILRFTPDVSLLASVLMSADLTKDSAGNPFQPQRGFVASTDLNQLSDAEIGNFLRNPASDWPTAVGKLKALQRSTITFLRYNQNPVNPTYPAGVTVALDTAITQSGKPERSLATINIDIPPDPACTITLTTGPPPLRAGTYANFFVNANSIAASARISADNNVTYQNPALNNQSIRNLGTFTRVAGPVALLVPKNPSPGTAFGGGRRWTIRAAVTGIGNVAGPRTCSLDVAVIDPPPPSCTLSASPPKPKINESTTLILYCLNDVSSTTINGIAVPFNQVTRTAMLVYTKTDAKDKVIPATATGLGGTTTTSVSLNGQCRWADPAHVENPAGIGYSREMASGGNTAYPLGGGVTYFYGGVDGTGWNASGPDVYWACGQRAYGLTKLPNYICMWSGYTNTPLWWTVSPSNLTMVEFYPADDKNCTITRLKLRPSGVGCFLAGTKIRTAEGRDVLIEHVRAGDRLLNPLTRRAVRVKEMTTGPEHNPLWTVQTRESELDVTETHPFLTERGLVAARDLVVGDTLRSSGGDYVSVTGVYRQSAAPSDWVWNMALEGAQTRDHFVLADGIPAGDLYLQNKLNEPRRKKLP